jgi:hypothetical protein
VRALQQWWGQDLDAQPSGSWSDGSIRAAPKPATQILRRETFESQEQVEVLGITDDRHCVAIGEQLNLITRRRGSSPHRTLESGAVQGTHMLVPEKSADTGRWVGL